MRRRVSIALLTASLLVPAAAFALATLTVDPSSVTFGTRCVRTTTGSTKPVTIRNQGDRDATGVSVRVSPSAYASIFPLSGATAVPTLAAGDDATVRVGFVPGRAGEQSAQARIEYTTQAEPNGNNTPPPQVRSTAVPLRGEGIDRLVDASPRALNFGDLRIGRSASERTVTVYDDGDSALTITSVSITGRNAGDFSVAPRGTRTIDESSPLRLRVGFTPRGVGSRLASLVIQTNACEDATVTVALAGVGVVQDIVALPGRVDFEPQRLGQRATREVVVANQGGAELRVTAVTLAGREADHFRIPLVPTLPQTLDPGESFPIRVRFVADEPGEWRARVDIESNDPDTKVLAVKMLGFAEEPAPTATPTATAEPSPLPTSTISPQARATEGRLGEYAEELAVAVGVAAFFLLLVVTRRIKGIPE